MCLPSNTPAIIANVILSFEARYLRLTIGQKREINLVITGTWASFEDTFSGMLPNFSVGSFRFSSPLPSFRSCLRGLIVHSESSDRRCSVFFILSFLLPLILEPFLHSSISFSSRSILSFIDSFPSSLRFGSATKR